MADVDALEMLSRLTADGCSLADLITLAGDVASSGQPALADQAYKVWIKFNPAHPQLCVALFNRSVLQAALGDNGGAAASLEQAIAINPDFMPAYVNLGGLQERAGLNELAIATWEAGANRPIVLNGLGVGYAFTCLKQIARLLGEMHQPARAELALQRAADIDPHAMDVIGQWVANRLAQCKWPAVQPTERVSRETALAGYTADAAYAGFAEKRFGRLAPGERADFIFVDTDPMTATPEAIRKTKVLETWVGGGKVWDAAKPEGGAAGAEPVKR